MTEYGTPDADTAAYDKLLTLAEGEITYILHHPRKALDEKNCQNPGSVRVQAVFADNRVLTVTQLRDGNFLVGRNW